MDGGVISRFAAGRFCEHAMPDPLFASDRIKYNGQTLDLVGIEINHDEAGDDGGGAAALVAAVADRRIVVMKFLCADQGIKLRTNAVDGAVILHAATAANGIVGPFDGIPYAATVKGEALWLMASTTGTVTGKLWYVVSAAD